MGAMLHLFSLDRSVPSAGSTEGRGDFSGRVESNCRTAGWSWGCVSAIDSRGRTIWIADAHRDDGKRFVVSADEMLTAFLELERVTHEDSN
jgi:hypothetical protein